MNKSKDTPHNTHSSRKQSEAKRATSTNFPFSGDYQSFIFQSLSVIFYTSEASGNMRTTWMSEQADRIIGFPPERFTENPEFWSSRIHPDEREQTETAFKSVPEKNFVEMEYRWMCADGSYHWFFDQVTLVRDDKENPVSINGIWLDITERKKAEIQINHSNSLLTTTLESTADGILVVDREGVIMAYNKKFTDLWNIPKYFSEIKDDKRLLSFVLDQVKYPEQFQEKVRKLYAEPEKNSEDTIEFKDGRVYERYSQPQVIGKDIVGRVWSFRDITDRKKTELYRDLAGEIIMIFNNTAEMKDAMEKVLDAIKTTTGCDAVGIRLQQGNDFPYIIQHGFSSDFLQTENTIVAHEAQGGICRTPDGKVCLECTCGVVISGKTDPANPLFTKGGSAWTNDSSILLDIPEDEDPRFHPRNYCVHQGYASLALIPIKSKEHIIGLLQINGRKTGLFKPELIHSLEGIAAHIGEAILRKQGEDAIRESEQVFSKMFYDSPVISMFTVPFEGLILDVNDAFLQVMEYTRDDVIGKTTVELGMFDDLADRSRLMAILREKNSCTGFECLFRTKNSKIIYGLLSIVFLQIKGASRQLSMIIDITGRKFAELALKESQERFVHLFERAPLGYQSLNEEGCLIEVNEAWTTTLGYNREEVIGKWFGDFLTPEGGNQFRERFPKFKMTGQVSNEFTMIHKNGSIRNIAFNGRIGYKDDGSFEKTHCILQDVTENRKVENKIKLLAHSLESISECVSITDKNDHLVFVNEAFLKTYGYPEEELLGQHISILRPPEVEENVDDILNSTLNGGWKGEIINQRKDGTCFPVLLSTSVIKDENNNLAAMIGVATDITEMKKNREELISAKEKAEESDRLKSVFLANVSHEIRTPMNGIVGFANLLKREDLTKEKQENFIEVINSSSKQLLAIISDIVEISKIETHQVKVIKSPAEINKIIDNVYNRLLILARKNENVPLVARKQCPKEEVVIHTDDVKLQQILSNLVENALKFTEAGRVEFGYTLDAANNIEFYVKDTGIGISKENFDLVFDRFRKIENKEFQLKSGSGLGLAISKSYVELLGGRIWLDSELGKGTTFFFTIPKEQTETITGNDEKSMDKLKPFASIP